MKLNVFILLLSLLLCCNHVLTAQKVQILTEDYKEPRESCELRIYELMDYLKGRGLFRDSVYQKTVSGSLNWLKKSLQIGNNDFAFISACFPLSACRKKRDVCFLHAYP